MFLSQENTQHHYYPNKHHPAMYSTLHAPAQAQKLCGGRDIGPWWLPRLFQGTHSQDHCRISDVLLFHS